MRFRITLASAPFLACGLFAATSPALAQSGAYAQDMLNDKFTISLGGFIVGTDVKGELNGRATGGQQEMHPPRRPVANHAQAPAALHVLRHPE